MREKAKHQEELHQEQLERIESVLKAKHQEELEREKAKYQEELHQGKLERSSPC